MRHSIFRSSWIVLLLTVTLAIPQGALVRAQARPATPTTPAAPSTPTTPPKATTPATPAKAPATPARPTTAAQTATPPAGTNADAQVVYTRRDVPAAYLGISFGETVERMGDSQKQSIKVQEISKDSPAEKAGMKVGDEILRVNGMAAL